MSEPTSADSRARAIVLAMALLATLAACRTPSPRPAAPAHAAPPDTSVAGSGAYDWHALLIVPIGSVLKDIPLNLHEVLLFRDEAHGSRPADDAECYAADAGLPRFAGRTPADYMLCFRHDRLSRIDVSVRLTTAEAPQVFAAACAGWLKHAVAPGDAACEGRDGDTRFSGRLDEEGIWFITLDGAPDP